jgi:hypothetical protein
LIAQKLQPTRSLMGCPSNLSQVAQKDHGLVILMRVLLHSVTLRLRGRVKGVDYIVLLSTTVTLWMRGRVKGVDYINYMIGYGVIGVNTETQDITS